MVWGGCVGFGAQTGKFLPQSVRPQHGHAEFVGQCTGEGGLAGAGEAANEDERHRRRCKVLVRQICAYFQIFWDEAEALERLAEMSHPRIVVDTSGLTPKATLVANLLSERIRSLDEAAIDRLLDVLNR